MRHVVVTGATGYIGARFCARARARGWRVTALSRRFPAWLAADEHVPYELHAPVPPLPAADALVHLAYDSDSRLAEADEVEAARALGEAAAGAGIARRVFVSSQSAVGPVSRYGRIKVAIEEVFAAQGGSVIRPGLVYGGSRSAGLFGTLWKLARLPLHPTPLPMPRVYPVHIDDLCDALLVLCDPEKPLVERVEVAGPPVTFAALLRAMAADESRWPRLPAPVPLPFVLPLAQAGGRFVPVLAWLAERLESFAAIAPIDGVGGLRRLGLAPRPLHDGLRPRGDARRHDLAREGRALLRYAGGFAPGVGSTARYVRAVERFESGRPLGLSRALLRFPGLAEARPPVPAALRDDALERRLDAAVVLAEATPQGGARFLPPRGASRPAVLLALAGAAVLDVARRVAQLAASPWLARQARERRERHATSQA